MEATAWHLAQLNVGVVLAPVDDELMSGFVEGLDPINAIADSAPGFVWRLQDDSGAATSFRITDDDRLLVNMSTWASAEALHDFVFRTEHTDYLRRRREWFEVPTQPTTVLWWVPAGHQPSLDEAADRLATLRANGPTPEAFTLRDQFPPQ
ncbi:MAG TPA: DUF3291 domain-containing protein [Mycobacteriales bacterium]|nr:DUF3291 domain-containing protein [Mycobacteriales bacterium]